MDVAEKTKADDYFKAQARRFADVVERLILDAGFALRKRGYKGLTTWVNFRSIGLRDIIDKYSKDMEPRDVVYALEISPESIMFKLSVYGGNDDIKKLLWDFFHPSEEYKRTGYKAYEQLKIMTGEQLASNTEVLDIKELNDFVNKYKEKTRQFEKRFEAWVALVFSPHH